MATIRKAQPQWSLCGNCGGLRIHRTVEEHVVDGGDEYQCATKYKIVECAGCKTIAFKKEFHDYEMGHPDENGDWDYDISIEIYPKVIKNHHELDGLYYVPKLVRDIYDQALVAIREGSSILAGLGLRATIEAICNECKIEGRNLDIRITKLASSGLISKKDAERLHAIRFLGNDAAHDIKGASDGQLSAALKIVDHLIQTIYILEHEVKDNLDTIISDYETLRPILEKKIRDLKSGDELTLSQILDRDRRRIIDNLSALEAELVARIQSKDFKSLTVGQQTNVAGGAGKSVQTFKVP